MILVEEDCIEKRSCIRQGNLGDSNWYPFTFCSVRIESPHIRYSVIEEIEINFEFFTFFEVFY